MIRYSHHSGESMSDAVIITGARSHYESVMAEYEYIKQRYLNKGMKYTIEEQGVLRDRKRYYDVVKMIFADGSKKIIFFDITESHDKFVIYPQ